MEEREKGNTKKYMVLTIEGVVKYSVSVCVINSVYNRENEMNKSRLSESKKGSRKKRYLVSQLFGRRRRWWRRRSFRTE